MKKENQVLTNFYKKEARKKAKKLIEDGMKMKEIMDYILDLDKLNKYKNEKMINIQFTKEEIDKYFKGIPVKQIKQNMLKLFDENINRIE